VVAGRAAMIAGDPERAVQRFAAAAERQKKAYPVFDNFDPPPWWYPVRRSLAAAHLKAGRYATAAREARASLADWPQDALALRVLSEAEAKLGQKKAAREHAAEARAKWQGRLAEAPLELT
jgi:predicted Zn-dependent protease